MKVLPALYPLRAGFCHRSVLQALAGRSALAAKMAGGRQTAEPLLLLTSWPSPELCWKRAEFWSAGTA